MRTILLILATLFLTGCLSIHENDNKQPPPFYKAYDSYESYDSISF